MIGACSVLPEDSSAISRLASYVECQAQNLGQAPFLGAANATYLPGMMTAVVTIYIAVIGYRFLLGRIVGPQDIVLATIRLGLVLAFATNWSAYQTLVYRLAIDGPAEISGMLLRTGPTADASPTTLAERAQKVLDETRSTASLAASAPAPNPVAPPLPPAPQLASPTFQAVTPASLGTSGVLFIISCLGGPVALRLVTGFLLALGPLFISAALFDATLGFFEGWVRALVSGALGGAALAVNSNLQLGFLEAEIARLGTSLRGTMTLQESLMTSGIVFSINSVVLLVGVITLTTAFKSPWLRVQTLPTLGLTPSAHGISAPVTPGALRSASAEPGSRAKQVADAVAALSRREPGQGLQPLEARHPATSQALAGAAGEGAPPLFSASSEQRHAISPRRSPGAARRDDRR